MDSARAWIGWSSVVALVLAPSAALAPVPPISALAPFEIVVDGLGDLRGIAVDATGRVFVADRRAGTVVRVAPDHSRAVVARDLERPIGLALDGQGRPLVAEERAARVVRIEPTGARTGLVAGVKQPRWLAVGADGAVFVSARRLTRGADPEPDDESAEPEMVLRLGPSGDLAVLADGFRQLQGLAAAEHAVYAVTHGARGEGRTRGLVYEIALRADGRAGAITPIETTGSFARPMGLARDALGALFIATAELTLDHERTPRALVKLTPGLGAGAFAGRLSDPQGVAFGPEGDLYVADGGAGRVLRFRPPSPPRLEEAPTFTHEPSVVVRGTSEASARIDGLVGDTRRVVTRAGGAGAFALSVPLAANRANAVEIFATAHAGDGLTSRPATATVVHDAVAPGLAFLSPPAGAVVGQTITVRARADDPAGQVADVTLSVAGRSLGPSLAPPPPASSVTAAAAWNTTAVPDGAHTLAAAALDRAGNPAGMTRVVVVDNTPPDVRITAGPEAPLPTGHASFTFVGSDNLTPAASLQYAWRLDGGGWSALAEATSAAVSGLAGGSHLFEVKARDLAGNETVAPARRAFTVGALRVSITEPGDGAVVPDGLLLVRGTVEAAGREVGVTLNGVVAAVQATAFVAQVPVDTTTTAVTAVATLAGGTTATQTIGLSVTASSEIVVLRASPTGGVAPLAVRFSLLGGPPAASVEVDADGDGVADFTGPSLEGQPFTYARPGVYVARVTAVDAAGGRRPAATVVQVLDRGGLDTLLQAKWTAMKDALRAGDIPAALEHITFGARAGYEQAFRAIAPRLPAIDAILPAIALASVRARSAVYDATRTDGAAAKLFEVRFVVDSDGVWRLQSF